MSAKIYFLNSSQETEEKTKLVICKYFWHSSEIKEKENQKIK